MPSPQVGNAGVPLTFSRWTAGVVVRWRIVARTMAVMIVLAIVSIFVFPPVYRAEITFVTNPSSTSKLATALGGSGIAGIASQMGLGQAVGGSEPSESPAFYEQLVASRELLTRLLTSTYLDPRTPATHDSARLVDILPIRQTNPARRMEMAVKRLRKSVRPWFDPKTSFVRVDVDLQWPALSASVANHLREIVDQFNQEQRRTRAKDKRTFLEGQVTTARGKLDNAEHDHKQFLKSNHSINSAELKYEDNRLQRNEDNASELYQTLLRQFEAAQLEEFDNKPLITVVDSAVAPVKAEWPRYGLVTMSTLTIGFALGILLAGFATLYGEWKTRDPSDAEEFQGAVAAMRGGMRMPFRKRRAG